LLSFDDGICWDPLILPVDNFRTIVAASAERRRAVSIASDERRRIVCKIVSSLAGSG
jgi:hypothetical protein